MIYIRRSSWHLRYYQWLAGHLGKPYSWHHIQTLCQYMSRLALGSLEVLFIYTIMSPALFCLVMTSYICAFVVLLFGFKPKEWIPWPVLGTGLEPYNLPRFMGIRWYPWKIVVLAGVGYAGYAYSSIFLWIVTIALALALIMAFLSAAVYFLFRQVRKSEILLLLAAYFKAKKQKICPLVEIVDDTKPAQQ